jgi:ribosomal protein S15P/S13E
MGKKSAATAQIDAVIGKSNKSRKKGKKGRKIGRYSKHPSSQRYKAERRWLTNKEKRIKRHLKRFPNDKQAQRALIIVRAA